MSEFDELAASRRAWIAEVLQPWCIRAPLVALREAEQDWVDIAGQVDSQATLWTWAWSRFPALVHEGLSGVNETHEVVVTLSDGTTVRGYPDGHRSLRGELMLLSSSGDTPNGSTERGPYSIDTIADVQRCHDG